MLIEITGDTELERLLGIDFGFLLVADYLLNLLEIHKINCKQCNPESNTGLSPSNKKHNNTGEIWFSNKRQKIFLKAREISDRKGCSITLCKICNP